MRELGDQIKPLFAQVLMTCDRLGLIGATMFAIDGVKLPANASKERSGTHAELRHRAERLDKAAQKIIERHRSCDNASAEPDLDDQRWAQAQALQREAQVTRDFVARTAPRRNRKGAELKANVTDNDSAKMATAKGVIQGYAAQAAVDSDHQIIVAADVTGSGSEQAMLLTMVEQTAAVRRADTLITADAGYHSKENLAALCERGIPALIADHQMRQRDARFAAQARHKAKPDPLHDKRGANAAPARRYRPHDFLPDPDSNSCICPAGQRLYSNGSRCQAGGHVYHKYTGSQASCGPCAQRDQCLRHPQRTAVRQVAIFYGQQATAQQPSERMKRAIDSPRGRALYGQRIATVEPVFANLRHNKRLNRFTLRGKSKVTTQWQLYCLVHNIEKLAHCGYQ